MTQTTHLPDHVVEYIIELADRFPDLIPDEVKQATVDYYPPAACFRERYLDRIYSDAQVDAQVFA